ncbi:trans-sialidase [Trypanosoma cruzi]|uniref:Trans-sialidase n=1 Tax=Trypanosoma cruzi TaxID=5693 RepID=A0A7J6YFF0_TRYCR|nr:trans-sialidase [Trypanosoma cruzi]
MPTMSYLWTRGIYMQHAQQRELLTIQAPIKKRQRGCRTPLMNAGDGSPIQSATSGYYAQAAHRTADAPPDLSNCPTKSSRRAMELIRKRRSTVVRRITDIPALGQLYEESKQGGLRDVGAVNVGAENVTSRQFTTFCRTHEQPMNKESRAAFLMAIDVAPPTRLQYARMLRSMLEMNRTPLGMVILELQKIAARSETQQAHPLTKEGMGQFIHSQTNWKERVVFRLAWITASRCFEIAATAPNNFTLERDGNIILYWPVAPKTAKADPHCAPRFFRARGQDALDIIELCGTLQHNEELTNLTTAQIERALAHWNATAHSTKQGALRHAAEIVETYNLDPHVILQLAKHVDPFDLFQKTVRYLGRYTTMMTQVSSLVALM